MNKSKASPAKTQEPPASPWRNRIVGSAEVPPNDLIAHDLNFRRHPLAQRNALDGAIQEVGYLRSVTVNKRNNRILDGHLRVELALEQKQAVIAVEYVDLTDEEEALALATIDPIAAMATAHKQSLTSLLQQTHAQSAGLQGMLADLAAKNGIALSHLSGRGAEDPLPQLDRAAELQQKWQTAPGQLWLIPSRTVAARKVAICPHCNHKNGVEP